MTFTAEQLNSARKEGYSDDEIWEYLGGQDKGFAGAKQEGYSLDEVAGYFSSLPAPTATDKLQSTAEELEAGVGRAGLAFSQAAVGSVRMLTDVFGANNPVSKKIAGVEDYLDKFVTAQAKQDKEEVSRLFQEAEEKGLGAKVMAGLEAVAVSPETLGPEVAGYMLPSLAAGVLTAGASLPVTIGAQAAVGGLQAAGTIKGEIYTSVRDFAREQGLDEEQADKVASEAQAYGGKNLDQILIGAGIGALASSTGVERIATRILSGQGKAVTKKSIGEFVKTGLKAGGVEGVVEGVQEGQEQMATNIALQREGADVSTFRMVPQAATMGAAAGALMGGAVGGIEFVSAEQKQLNDIEKTAERESRSLSAPDAATQSAVNILNQTENSIDSLREELDILEPTDPRAQNLRLRISEEQKKAEALKVVIGEKKEAVLSEPIAAAEAEQARLAREIAAPVEEAAPAEPTAEVAAPTAEAAPVEPTAVAEAPAPTVQEGLTVPPTEEAVTPPVEPTAAVEETPAAAPAPKVAEKTALEIVPQEVLEAFSENQPIMERIRKDALEKKGGSLQTYITASVRTKGVPKSQIQPITNKILKQFPESGLIADIEEAVTNEVENISSIKEKKKSDEIKLQAALQRTGETYELDAAIQDYKNKQIELERAQKSMLITPADRRRERVGAKNNLEKSKQKLIEVASKTAVAAPAEAAPAQRDVTKPEQMTPDEAIDDALRKAEISPTETGFMVERDRGIVGSNAEEIHYVAVSSAIESLNPVSAEAVESYGITLPEGYAKQGDLYVYQPAAPAPAAPTGIAGFDRTDIEFPSFDSLNDYQKKSYREGTPVTSGRAKGFIETEENFFVDPAQLPAGAVVDEDLDAFAYPKEDGTIGYVFMDLDGFAKSSIAPDQLAAKVKALSTATPAAPAEAAPVGIAVGNRIKLGKSPQTYTIEEVIPQTEAEKELGEQYYSVRNEKTGEVQTVEAKDLKPVKAKGVRKMAARIKDESLVVPEAERYTFEQAEAEARKLFGGMPEGFIIVNDSVDPEYEFKAGYEPSTGDIILNLAYIRQGESVRNLIAHELGHYAAGDPEIRAKLQEFLDALPATTRAKLERFVEKVYNDETGDIRLEEKQVRAFVQMLKAGENRNVFQKLLDAIKKWLNENLGTNFQPTDMDAAAVLSGAINRYKSGEKIAREDGEMREAKVERYDERSQVAGVPGIGAIKDTPKGINTKTEKIIKDQVFDSDTVSDNQTKKAWNLISRLQESNSEAGKNAQAINELTRETMQDVEAEDIVKQTIGAAKLRNELFKYAIKLTAEGDRSMLDYLLNNRLAIAGGAITEGDAGRLLQALSSLKSWIQRSSEAEQTGFFTIAAQQFFDTKNPTDKQIKQIQDMFEAVKKVKVDQEKDLMTELEEVGKATGIDLPAVVQKQLDATPRLDPMVVAMINMIKLAGGGRIVFEKFPSPRGEAVKKTILGGLADYRKKMVGKGATGLETGFWKTLSDKEEKPGPLGELDAYQNRELGNIVKSTLIGMGLKGTPPDTKMTIYEQVATILGEQPLGNEKIKMADERIAASIGAKREAEVENARSEEEVDAINAKYDQIQFAWDEAMSRQTEMPVSDALIRRLIFAELKEADTSIADIATLMDEEPAIGASRQDTLVRQIIEKITDVSFEGKEYAQLQSYLSEALESMVIARQQKNRTAKSMASIKRQAGGDPTKQAQAQIDKLAKIQADPTIFGEKKIDPVRNAVRDALSLQLNIGFTPEQTADIKRNWKGAYVADPNQKGLPSSFMLEMQRLGVKESAADILAEIVWKQIEVNAMSKQMDATTKAVEAGPIGGMVQAILDTPLAMQQDPDWQKKVILDYLKNAGVKPAQAEKIASLFDISLRKRFAQAQEQAAEKAAKAIMGKLTPNSRRALEKFMRAIRAQVLNPGTDVAKAFGEQMGWKGFTKEDITRLNELDSIVNDSERTDAEVTVAIEQINQIIDKVSMPPQVKDVISSYYVGNILGRFTTFAIQAFDPLMFTTFDATVKSFTNITSPAQLMSVWANYGRAVSNLIRETAFSYKNDVLRSGKMIDYMNNEDRKIGRLWREAERKYKAGDIKGAMKDGIIGYTSQTFRILKALDDGAYSLLITNTLPSYVDAALKRAKVPRDKRRGVMRRILEAREIDIKNFENQGVPRNDAIVYANERMTLAVQQELGNMKLPEGTANEVVNSALNDALSRIGKTRFMEDVLGGDKQELKDEGFFSSIFLRFYENVAKSVNQKGGSEWQKVFYRVLLGFPLIPARIFNISAGYTPLTIYRHLMPKRYSLTYGTSLQRRQRLLEQMAGTMVLLPLLMLRSSSFDDEEEKKRGFGVYITGQGPSRAKDKETHAQWNRRHKPYSIEVVVGGKKASIDAKSSGPLAVMIYTLGALDDWQIRRIQDGMKTSKEDLKDIEEKSDLFTAMYDLAGSFVLTTARRGPTTGVMQGLVNFQRYPDDPIAAIGQEAAFAAAPAIPILGTGIAKNLSDFFSEPIDNRTKEGALISNFPIVGPVLGQPALNAYGQKIGELKVSEKLKKSFGIPFTLVPTENENDYKLSAITLKFGNGPTHLRREAVEVGVGRAITDEEWYKAATAYGKYNREKILESYDYHFGKSQEKFDKTMTKMSETARKRAIEAVTEKTP